jgi:hypothetical protein
LLWQVGVAWQSTRELESYVRVGAFKKLTKDAHLRAGCVTIVSSSCMLLSIAFTSTTFKTWNTMFN